jgi:hypothetical protein
MEIAGVLAAHGVVLTVVGQELRMTITTAVAIVEAALSRVRAVMPA